jgi:hypothetical protein
MNAIDLIVLVLVVLTVVIGAAMLLSGKGNTTPISEYDFKEDGLQ